MPLTESDHKIKFNLNKYVYLRIDIKANIAIQKILKYDVIN